MTLLNGTVELTDYETFIVERSDHVAHVRLNRPHKANALDQTAWRELEAIFRALDAAADVRAIVLSGEGKHFCSGIDLSLLMAIRQNATDDCEGRSREKIHQFVQALQAPVNAIEQCRKPVLAAIHGACVGGGVDIVTACDMRYATTDAFFAVAEIDMGMVADLGTLQRLPRLIGEGPARELAYTGRRMDAAEAHAVRLVNRLFADRDTLIADVLAIAATIAAKSPLAVRGSKQVLNYSRDHSVADGLAHIATWNAAMILSNDLNEAFMAKLQNRPPQFAD